MTHCLHPQIEPVDRLIIVHGQPAVELDRYPSLPEFVRVGHVFFPIKAQKQEILIPVLAALNPILDILGNLLSCQ